MHKKWIALLLAAVLCVGLLPVAAGAEGASLPDYGFYTARSRSEATYTDFISYVDLTDGVVWLLCENGFTEEKMNSVTVKIMLQDGTTETLTPTAVQREDSDGRYDLMIQLPEMTGDSRMSLTAQGSGFTAQCPVRYALGTVAKVGGYVIGFGEPTGNPIEIFASDARFGRGTDTWPNPDNPRSNSVSLGVYGGVEHVDEMGFPYYEIETDPEKLQLTVKEMWIEPLDCDEQTFSWTRDGDVLEKEDGFENNIGTLYLKDGYAGYARIWASVEVQCGGGTDTVQVSVVGFVKRYGVELLERETGDTVKKLNEDLVAWAGELEERGSEESVVCDVLLAENTNYEGTIVIPETFEKDRYTLNIIGRVGTILTGGIDLNQCGGLKMVQDLTFRAPEIADGDETKALFNGSCSNAYGCTFSGYDVALDASANGMINAAHSVFVNNGIAARVDIENLSSTAMNSWTDNLFVDNGIAVQVLSLNEFLSPYYFRVVDSTFINNETDFDVRCGGTVYFYRNYYGASELDTAALLEELASAATEEETNRIATARAALVKAEDSRVIVNPRWKLPATEGLKAVNVLVADWETETEIVNKEAQDLLLDESAFAGGAEKQINVVDENANELGVWTFD